jgi:predicted transcriptional regulator
MALTVGEIMNRELFKVREQELASDVLHYFVALGIAGAPVVDAHDKLIGFVSWRDLFVGAKEDRVGGRMTAPVDSVVTDTLISHAARRLPHRPGMRAITGSTMRNVVPEPGTLSYSSVPSCAARIWRAIGSPRPVPLGLVVRNGSKTST